MIYVYIVLGLLVIFDAAALAIWVLANFIPEGVWKTLGTLLLGGAVFGASWALFGEDAAQFAGTFAGIGIVVMGILRYLPRRSDEAEELAAWKFSGMDN